MSLLKRVTRIPAVQSVICWIAAQYIRLVFVTGRWEQVGDEVPNAYWDQGRPFILAFWHGRLLLLPYIWRRGVPVHMLISQHRDGQLIAKTIGHFGITWLAGSTSKGGGAAIRAMLKALKAGQSVGITPDGPRGPRMWATDGVVQVAKLSGCPILPIACAANRRKLLRSWDRFAVVAPFSRGVFLWGQPIEVPRDATPEQVEEYRQQLQTSLQALSMEADLKMGVPPVLPAAPGETRR